MSHSAGRLRDIAARCFLLASFLLLMLGLAPPAPSLAAKAPTEVLGEVGTEGGSFRSPSDLAINQSTGHIYVADNGNNRIQRLAADGSFERAWGRGVVSGGGSGDVPGANEVQTITVSGDGGTFRLGTSFGFDPGIYRTEFHQLLTVVGDGGTFTLTLGALGKPSETTADIPRAATAAEVESAIAALPIIGAGNVEVSGANGGPWDVEFPDFLVSQRLISSGDKSKLTGATTSVTRLSGHFSSPIPRAATAAEVEAALESITYIGPGNVSVSGPAGGPWQVEFTDLHADANVEALDSDDSELTGAGKSVSVTTTAQSSTAFEICTVVSECRGGIAGSLGGELGGGDMSLAIDEASGHLYVSDANNRVTEFDADGNFIRAWGSGVVAPGGSGDVPGNEIQRYTTRPGLPPTSGALRLRVLGEETAPVQYDATAAEVQSALEALAAFAPGDVVVSGVPGAWRVEFAGAYADVDAPSLDVKEQNDFLDHNGDRTSAEFETVIAAGAFEICTVASQCRAGTIGGAAAGQVRGVVREEGSLQIAPIAVGPTGDVFLGDPGNSRVNQYTATGSFIRSWGWGVDTGAQAFEICAAGSGCNRGVQGDFKATNAAKGQFFTHNGFTENPDREFPGKIAVDDAGVLYALNRDTQQKDSPRIERFHTTQGSPAGLLSLDPIRSTAAANGAPAGPLPTTSPSESAGFELDPGSGNLFYPLNSGEVLEIQTAGAGAIADTHLPGIDRALVGIGYQEDSERLLFTLSNDHRLIAASEPAPAPPLATLEDPQITGETSALFSGEVTPGGPTGIDTFYRFEYRKVGTPTWTKLPASAINIGDGTHPVSVQQTVTGLEAGAEYEVRLVAFRELGVGTTTTDAKQFLFGDLPPVVTTVYPQARTDETAVLAGRIDPRNNATQWYFEWGTDTSYGNRIPVPDGTLPATTGAQRVIAQISGLSPNTTYHYRLFGDNGVEEGPGDTLVEGEDVSFTTRATVADPPTNACHTGPATARCYEMVTPPFKPVRAAVGFGGGARRNPNLAMPALDGDAAAWQIPFFPLDETVDMPAQADMRIIRRTAAGWVSEAQNTLPLLGPEDFPKLMRIIRGATSGDFEAHTLQLFAGATAPGNGALLPTEGPVANRLYTYQTGTGVEGLSPWLTNPQQQVLDIGGPVGMDEVDEYAGAKQGVLDDALLNDDGSALARWGLFGGLAEDPATPGDEDPSDDQDLQGTMLYSQRAASPLGMPSAPKDLVNECTGTGGAATAVPARVGTGAPTDMIGARSCEQGSLVDLRGAEAGGDMATTALAGDGSGVFFQSPARKYGPSSCTSATGAATSCPPQLYVRQYGSLDPADATVRWISRSRSVATGEENSYTGAMIAGQQIGLMGAGATFEGASRDGSVVYFKTNAPLTPDDPNGTGTPGPKTTGDASHASWDLYRYELPAAPVDPENGRLTRISGGPSGTADPNTNPFGPGMGGTARFVSEDGRRVYFLTGSPLGGADAIPPKGGMTTPGTASSAIGGTSRNLYLFDDSEEGADRYRFIARLPFYADGTQSGQAEALNACATVYSVVALAMSPEGPMPNRSCFRGTPDGRAIAFHTAGQLTGDDADGAGDVYLYDAEEDELVRASAPPAGADSYTCNGKVAAAPGSQCNGDLGFKTQTFAGSMEGLQPRGFSGLRTYNLAENPDGTVSLFFQSKSQLVPEDQNGDFYDTYEWREGELSLISRAEPGGDAWYSGNSLDGRDVFFVTTDRIDPREIDDADYDVYDARRGSLGFPYTPPPTPCNVLALKCEGQALPVPPARSPQSAGFNGTGNVGNPKSRKCRKGKVRRRGKCVRRKATKRGKAAKRRAANQRKGGRR